MLPDGFEWMKLSEETGKFELTGEPLKIEPLGLIIIVFLLGILIVQTFGMFIHRVNTLIGAFHEVCSFQWQIQAAAVSRCLLLC